MSFNFENLEVYKKAQKLAKEIFELTESWPRENLYDITSQLRTAILSIVLNIAEDSSRSVKENRHFLDISRGSCYETVAVIDLASQLSLINYDTKLEFYQKLTEISKMLSGLKSSLK